MHGDHVLRDATHIGGAQSCTDTCLAFSATLFNRPGGLFSGSRLGPIPRVSKTPSPGTGLTRTSTPWITTRCDSPIVVPQREATKAFKKSFCSRLAVLSPD